MSAVPVNTAIGEASAFRNTVTIARRNLLHIKSNPELIVEMTIQPLMFLVLFVFVFGATIAGSWQKYLQYALPGILVQSVAFLPFATAIGLNVDFQRGVIDRFRSMPIARSAVIGGRILADSVRITWSIFIISAFSILLGFRFGPDVNPVNVFLAFLVLLGFGLAMCWPMAFVGIIAKSTESVNTLGFMLILPLTFASSAFVEPDKMPGILGAFAAWNPVTAVIDTVRSLMLRLPMGDAALRAVGWMALLVAIFAPLAVARYRKRG